MKAFMVWPGGSPIDGCVLVVAENVNKAKLLGLNCFWNDCEYIWMRAIRKPEFDQLEKGCYESEDEIPEGFPIFYLTEEEINNLQY